VQLDCSLILGQCINFWNYVASMLRTRECTTGPNMARGHGLYMPILDTVREALNLCICDYEVYRDGQ
jgi:hypothetical protein